MDLISIIVVNYNGRHIIGECIQSLSKQDYKNFEVIVVDNGSEDGSVQFIGTQFPWVTTIQLQKNIGFAGGNNEGIKIAKGRYIALLNNDAVAHPEWLQNLIRDAKRSPETGMWASKILSYYNPKVIDNVGLLIYADGIARGKGRGEIDKGQYDKDSYALIPSGCACLYRREMIEQVGMFDDEFFAYVDDVDLGLRGRLAGWGCRYVPDAIVYHKYSASTPPPLKAFLVERNRLWLMIRLFPIDMIIMSPIYTITRLFYQFLAMLKNKGASGKFKEQHSSFQLFIILLKAWCNAIQKIPHFWKKRGEFKRIKRLSNREFKALLKSSSISAKELAFRD